MRFQKQPKTETRMKNYTNVCYEIAAGNWSETMQGHCELWALTAVHVVGWGRESPGVIPGEETVRGDSDGQAGSGHRKNPATRMTDRDEHQRSDVSADSNRLTFKVVVRHVFEVNPWHFPWMPRHSQSPAPLDLGNQDEVSRLPAYWRWWD